MIHLRTGGSDGRHIGADIENGCKECVAYDCYKKIDKTFDRVSRSSEDIIHDGRGW